MSLQAKDIMTAEVLTVTPSTPLREFARMVTEDRISGCPVLRVDGTLVGIVSKTDLIQRLLEDDPKFGSDENGSPIAFQSNVRQVDDIMNPEVLTVGPDTGIHLIAARMAEDRVHRVVVMHNDRVVGIITSLDLLGSFPQPG